MKNSFRPWLEVLDRRDLLSAGPLPPALNFQVTNLAVKSLDILPNAQDKVIGAETVSVVGKGVGVLKELDFAPASGSTGLYSNIATCYVYADLNPKIKGCETLVGFNAPDYYTGELNITLFNPLVVLPGHAIRLEEHANFNLYLSGPQIGIELAQAKFCDPYNNSVLSSHVQYRGALPTLHHLESHEAQLFQFYMSPFGFAFAGQTDVSLLQFGAWTNADSVYFVSFAAAQGSLQNATNWRLVHTTFDSHQDVVVPGFVVGDQVRFGFYVPPFQSGTWTLEADIVPVWELTANPSIQMAVAGLSVFDLDTDAYMQGFISNGFGTGQVLLWTQKYYTTH